MPLEIFVSKRRLHESVAKEFYKFDVDGDNLPISETDSQKP